VKVLDVFMTSFSNGMDANIFAKELAEKLYDQLNHNTDSFVLCIGDGQDFLFRLYELGFRHLYCMDADKRIYDRPNYTRVKYLYGKTCDTKFPSSMFDVVICPSCFIGCSFNWKKLLLFVREMKRILKNDGLLVFHGLKKNSGFDGKYSWLKVSTRPELLNGNTLFSFFSKYGMNPLGNFSKADTYFSFRVAKIDKRNTIRQVNIVCSTLGFQDGISACTENLAARFISEGIKVNLFRDIGEIKDGNPIIVEYEPGMPYFKTNFPRGHKVIIEAHSLLALRIWNRIEFIRKNVTSLIASLNGHNKLTDGKLTNPPPLTDFRKLFLRLIAQKRRDVIHYIRLILNFPIDLLRSTLTSRKFQKQILLVRDNEIARIAGLSKYTIMPLSAFPTSFCSNNTADEIVIGSFGYATKSKNYDKICELAIRLNVRAILLLGVNNVTKYSESQSFELAQSIARKYQSDKIRIKIGNFSQGQIREAMLECSHIVFAQDSVFGSTASMRLAISIGKPVIATDTFQSRDSQVYRVKSLEQVNIDYLKKVTEPINLDDGFHYLKRVLESM